MVCPQVFTAAGNSGGASGRTLSHVVGMGYLAILAGPSAIGWLAAVVSLNTAFVVPLGAVLICAAMAGVIDDPRRLASAQLPERVHLCTSRPVYCTWWVCEGNPAALRLETRV